MPERKEWDHSFNGLTEFPLNRKKEEELHIILLRKQKQESDNGTVKSGCFIP